MPSTKQLDQPYFDRVSDSVLIISGEGTVQYANPAFLKLSDHKEGDVIGKPIDALSMDEAFNYFFWNNSSRLKDGKTFSLQVIRPNREGKLSYYHVELMAVDESSDNSRYFIMVIRDISRALDKSERFRLLESELLQATNTLKHLLYKSSHDLRAPIASIKGLATLARKNKLDTDTLNYLDLILTNSSKMDSLLYDLRKIYTIYLGQFKKEQIDFKKLLAKVLKALKHDSLLSDTAIDTNIQLETPYSGYRFLLERIFWNLVDNALRYRKCHTSGSTHRVTINIERCQKGLSVSIHDNGKGISQYIQSRMFEMFYKGEHNESRNGMGLFIVKTVIEKLNGSIEVDSEPGKGTKVKVTLPE
ncbi:sensory box histidine kinase PhoR [Fulvivirga imtechensis AK7]|uniref:histidine kinase n=1 Tax=Fulvivirga imtechensis AK7 TaxID=1237149 RepID=L8JHL1_9BACT|nr:PAS domain-containing sensor histidine kinase [Fulvivirga imtechensis]ELR68336.1 sensory box histidine kinase PhoR [Fulvivirga imtechensis AK7]